MEPLFKDKRQVVAYIPYRIRSAGLAEYFLQKRDMNAPVHAGIFSLFGGGIEGEETLSEALVREVREELCIAPINPVYFTKSERSLSVFNTFIEEVGSDFETRIDVQEGEYGKFMTLAEAKQSDISAIAFAIVTDIDEWIIANTIQKN